MKKEIISCKKAINIFNEIQKKYEELPNIDSLNDEDKAWLEIKIFHLTLYVHQAHVLPSDLEKNIRKISNKLVHLEDDIESQDLETIAVFLYSNLQSIKIAITKKITHKEHGK